MSLILVAAQVTASAAAAHPPRLQNDGALLRADDFPAQAASEDARGIVTVLLSVDSAGKPTNCEVTETSGHRALDAQTCAVLLRRARFEAATDAGGAAVAGEYRMATTWGAGDDMPANMPRIREDLQLTVATVPPDYRSPTVAKVVFDAGGRSSVCEIVATSGSAAADKAVCLYLRDRTIPAPKSGSNRAPAAAVRTFAASLTRDGDATKPD